MFELGRCSAYGHSIPFLENARTWRNVEKPFFSFKTQAEILGATQGPLSIKTAGQLSVKRATDAIVLIKIAAQIFDS
ncbi:unnamed protein product [Pleuronectes platessa]|uniref:Uncharacterized protein n=1 Tax=Pleuronectes platessa TaxID=8262 RepID=A0A9N7YCI1_PLEPL|nr:unnamed protein product [Pleuronectes platessa]